MNSNHRFSSTGALGLVAVPFLVAGLASRYLGGPGLFVCLLLAVFGFVVAAVLTLLARRPKWPKNAGTAATAVYLGGALLLAALNDTAMVGLAWTSVGAIAGVLAFSRAAE